MKKMSVGILILAMFVPLLIGAVSASLSAKGMVGYGEMAKPPLSPPAWLFSVAWTVLYLMMGLASYFIIVSEQNTRYKAIALIAYAVQLVMNFVWSIIFFNREAYLFAFVWLIVMWLIVIFCTVRFYSISKVASYLFIPYVVWLTFAAYLNMGAYILSR